MTTLRRDVPSHNVEAMGPAVLAWILVVDGAPRYAILNHLLRTHKLGRGGHVHLEIPIDQRERFEQQAQELAKGDDEAHPYDEEFLYALEGGMPPTGGCGIGLERLAMVLTGAEHIREIMFFPMMKPKEEPGNVE